MAPVLTYVAALATVVATSGISFPTVITRASMMNLRGGRKLQEGMCNFIGCPSGFVPIADAMNVECEDDPCAASQCCEAFCSFHACPNNFIPITDAATIMCEDSGCTDDLCCVSGIDMGTDDTTSTDESTDDEETMSFSFSFSFGADDSF